MPQAPIWERDGTLGAIERLLSAAQEGRGRSLFIVGEAGLGKTTMIDRAQQGVAGSFRIGIGRGDAAESSLPFGIIDQALRGLGFRRPSDAKAPRQTPLQARATRLYAAEQFLESLPSPGLILLDDLHWADEDSLALLSFLCRRIGSLPIAVIGTLRPWPPSALNMLAPLATGGDATVEQLMPLSAAASTEMLNDRTGTTISGPSAQRATKLAAGNPLLLEQIASNVRSGRGVPDAESDGGNATNALLRARFTGVAADGMRYAQAASVLGTRFRPMIANAMAELSEEDGDRVLEAMCRGGVFDTSTPGRAQFAHPLLQQLVYDEIPAPLRARWHARAFRLLVAAGADTDESAEHAARSGAIGDPDAIRVLALAGRTALREGAIARAKQRLEAAAELAGSRANAALLLDLGEALVDSGDGRGAIAAARRLLDLSDLTDRQRIAGQRILGRALFVRGAHAEAADAFQAAVVTALRSDKSEAVRALLDAAFIAWPSGGPALATPLLEQARELAAESSPRLRLRADTAWAFSAFVGGDPAGIAVLEGAVREALANPEDDTTDFAWSWGTLGTYANMAKWTERFAEATRAYEIGMQAAERMGLPVAIAAVAVMHGDTCIRTGRLREALELADRATMLADLAPERAFWAAIIHAYTLADMGRMQDAAEWHRQATALAEPNEQSAGHLWLLHVGAVLAMHERRTADACALFDRLRALASQLHILEPCIVPWSGDAITAYGHGGRLEDARDLLESLESRAHLLPCRFPRVVALSSRAAFTEKSDPPASRRLLDEAIGLATESGMPLLEARLRYRLGAQLRRSGQDVAARRLLRRALELADGCGAEGWAKKAGEELKLAGGRQSRRRPDPDSLTDAELRVRALAERGVKPAKIAGQLMVSVNTIETHLQHIFRKLGINSQRELMALARDRDDPSPNGGDRPHDK